MKKIHPRIFLFCGLISMLATIIFYLILFDNIFALPIRWLSLLCLLIVELLGTIKAHKVRASIWGESAITVSLLHLIAVLILSIIFVGVFPLLLRQYLLLNCFFLAIVAVIDLTLLHFERRYISQNTRYTTSSNIIDECLAKAQRLLLSAKAEDCKKKLEKIVELLKYSNRSALAGNENIILVKLNELEDLIQSDNTDAVSLTAMEIQNLLSLRTEQLKKRGSF